MTGTTHDDPKIAPAASHPDVAELSGCQRRQILRAMGIVALGAGGVGTLAACASDDAGTSPSTGSQSSTAPSTASSSSASSPSSSGSSSASSGSSSSAAVPDGTKVAKSEIPVGGGKILEDDYVVTQPTAGTFKAFSKKCTHQGNPVGSIEGTNIICPFHGSKFSITDGSVTAPPATKALQEFQVVQSGSDIVIVA